MNAKCSEVIFTEKKNVTADGQNKVFYAREKERDEVENCILKVIAKGNNK